MIAQKRDANEGDIIAAARAAGAIVKTMDKSMGFDLLVVKNDNYIVEVKNPAVKWKYTSAELRTIDEVLAAGSKYYTVINAEEILRLVLGEECYDLVLRGKRALAKK